MAFVKAKNIDHKVFLLNIRQITKITGGPGTYDVYLGDNRWPIEIKASNMEPIWQAIGTRL